MTLQDFLDAQDRLDTAKQEVYLAEKNFKTMAERLAKNLLMSNFWTCEEIDHRRWWEVMSKIFNFRDSLWEIEWTPSVIEGCRPRIKSLRLISSTAELKNLPE